MTDSDSEVSQEVEHFLYSLLHHDYNPDLPVTAHGLDISSFSAHQIGCVEPEVAEPSGGSGSGTGPCKRPKKTDRRLASMSLSAIEKLRKRSIAGLHAMKRKCQQSPEERLEKARESRTQRKPFDVDRTPSAVSTLCSDSSSSDENSSSSDATVESDLAVVSSTPAKFKRRRQHSALHLHVTKSRTRDALKAEDFQRGKHPWWVDPEDLLPASQRTKRYFNSQYQGRCDTCDMKGHESDACPLQAPICICCGKLGHRKSECPRVICHACFLPGHEEKNCAMADKWRDIVCSRCGTKGHVERNCFEKWRQFHATVEGTTPRPTKQMKNKLVYCSNCARRGHWFHNCRRRRVRSLLLYCPSSPFVHRYDRRAVFRDDGRTEPGPAAHDESAPAAPSPEAGSEEKKKSAPQGRADGDLGNVDFVPLKRRRRRGGLGNRFKAGTAAAQRGSEDGTAGRSEAGRKGARRINKKQRRGGDRPVSARRARHQEMDEWLFSVADGEALTFKKRLRLLDSVSAVLHSIDGREDAAPRSARRAETRRVARQTRRRKKIQI